MKVKSHNHRGWKEPLEIKSNPVLKKVPCSRLHMKAFIWVLNVSVEGDSQSLWAACSTAVTLTVMKCLHTELKRATRMRAGAPVL